MGFRLKVMGLGVFKNGVVATFAITSLYCNINSSRVITKIFSISIV